MSWIGKYRKRPVVIEAMRLTESSIYDVVAWAGLNPERHVVSAGFNIATGMPVDGFLIIPTLEGDHKATLGDYIIKGVAGEFYPCKPDIFEKTYEVAE